VSLAGEIQLTIEQGMASLLGEGMIGHQEHPPPQASSIISA
jgi:hypothetical protein